MSEAVTAAPESVLGKPVKRREDLRFITGRGRYTDDIKQPGQRFAVFLRSPYTRARVTAIDSSGALEVEGVEAVLTGADMAGDGLGDLPCGWLVKQKDGSDMVSAPHPPLAVDRVNYVGEPFALVVADSLFAARQGAEAVMADFEELEAVVEPADATGSAQIHDAVPHNRAFDWELGERDATEAALAGAAHVTRLELTNNRLIPNAMEPRAAVGVFDAATGEHTLYTTSQNPHLERLVLSALVQVAPEHKLRVVAPDVGGGFGSKIFIYPEETAVIWAARRLGRPVKWTAERGESLLSDAHGRDHVTTAELGLDDDGNFVALRVNTTANLCAYLSTFGSSVPTYLYGTLLAGQYRTPNIYVEVQGVYTNTAPVDAYRGAGRPEATYVVERVVDKAARELGRDQIGRAHV